MPTTPDAIPVVKHLPVPLTDEEKLSLGDRLAKKKAEIDTINAKKRADNAERNKEKKEATKVLDELALQLNTGCEVRAVNCEERRDLETNEIVTFRLDRNPPHGEEIPNSRRPYGQSDTKPEEAKQPGLFDGKRQKRGALPVPKIVCNAIDEDGEIHVIGAELADALDHELKNSKSVTARVDAGERVIVKIVRGKACGTCGIVGGDHRPECAEMKREEKGLVLAIDTAGGEHEVDLETAQDIRDANRAGVECTYYPEGPGGDAAEVDLAMVKGEPVYGVTEDGDEHELTPQQVGGLRQAIRDMANYVMQDGTELVAFAGMREAEEDAEIGDDEDDGAATLAALGEDADDALDGKAPKRGAKKSGKSVKVKPKKRAKRGAASQAEAEAE